MIVAAVAAETLYIEVTVDEALDHQQIDLSPLLAAGLLTVTELEDDELEMMIDFARSLDEGEAATLAAASQRGCEIATDDRAAIRFVSRNDLPVQILRTSTVIRNWAESTGQDVEIVREALVRVEMSARFVPSPTDPEIAWWEQHAGRSD